MKKALLISLLCLFSFPVFSQTHTPPDASCGPPAVLGPIASFPTTELFDVVTNANIFCVPIRQCTASLIASKMRPGSNFNVQVLARENNDPVFALFMAQAQIGVGENYGILGYGIGGYGGGSVSVSGCSIGTGSGYGSGGYGQIPYGS